MKSYDVAVLGAGPGGLPAAKQAARRGASVCLIEQNQLGGVCLNVGCMPTKALLNVSDIYYKSRNQSILNLPQCKKGYDGPEIMSTTAKIINHLRDTTQNGLDQFENIELVYGRGTLVDKNSIIIETGHENKTVCADSIIIATGSSPVLPDFLPWESDRLITSNEALTAPDLPDSILIMGAGVIGCEFASIYTELGIDTTLIEMMPDLLPALDCPDASKAAREILKQRKANIRTGSKVQQMQPSQESVTVKLESGQTHTAQYALIAVGRTPNVAGIGLSNTDVKIKDGIIDVDNHCRTSVDNIYAAGDVAEKRQYTHLANRMGKIAGDNAAGADSTDDFSLVPVGIYTHPNITLLGLTEKQARQKYDNIVILETDYSQSGTAVCYQQAYGKVKLIVNDDTQKIIGALWIAPHSTDMIHEILLAMETGLKVDRLCELMHAHPSFQEALADAVEPYACRNIPKKQPN
jgi:dihydrolipoamide dehydrogenase